MAPGVLAQDILRVPNVCLWSGVCSLLGDSAAAGACDRVCMLYVCESCLYFSLLVSNVCLHLQPVMVSLVDINNWAH